jgi:hypothetical protein
LGGSSTPGRKGLVRASGGEWIELLIDVDGNGEFLGIVKVTGTPDARSAISFCDDLIASIA